MQLYLAALEQQVSEGQAQIDNLTKACAEQLEAERTDLEARPHLLNEEMVRAEAQINLIKDVLLREPGL